MMQGSMLDIGEIGDIEVVPQKRDTDGTWRKAVHHRSAGRWRARAHFRGFDGITGERSRYGKTRNEAVEKLEAALKEVPSLGASLEGLKRSMPIAEAGDVWLEQIKRPESKLAASTIDDYERALKNHIKGEKSTIRGLTLEQVNDPQRLRMFLQDVADRRGTGAAKMARQVVAGILWMAVENGIFDTNAIRMVRPVEAKESKKTERQEQHDLKRAFTDEEGDAVIVDAERRAREATHPSTVRKWITTADLHAFMRGTAARIGEARAVEWEDMDVLTGWVLILGTKTPGSKRAVKMPSWLLERMRERAARIGVEGLVFPSPHQIRDPWKPWDQSNCSKAVRTVLDGAKMLWAVPHTWRRTVASKLEDAGWKWSDIADQLGHADPSMTADHYLDRDLMARGDSRAADIL